MRYRLPTSLMVLLIAPFLATAGQAPAIRVRTAELNQSPFIIDSLKLTFTKFNKDGPLGIGKGWVEVRVENMSSAFAVFSPQRLSLVSADNEQAGVMGVPYYQDKILPAVDRKLAPYARIKELYVLSDKLQLPARLYYDEKLVGTIAE